MGYRYVCVWFGVRKCVCVYVLFVNGFQIIKICTNVYHVYVHVYVVFYVINKIFCLYLCICVNFCD